MVKKFQDYKWLFTSDKDQRGNFFSKLFITNLAQAINEANAADIRNHPAALRIMISQEYEIKDLTAAVPMRDNDIHWEFTDFIIKTALFHRKIDPNAIARGAAVGYTTLTDPDAQAVYNNIFAKWSSLDDETQNFYKTFIELLYRQFPAAGAAAGGAPTWVPVDPVNYGRDISADFGSYRLNLKKPAPNQPPLFQRILPKYYQAYSPHVWFTGYNITPAAGVVPRRLDLTHENLNIAAPADDLFRVLYWDIYNHAPIPVAPAPPPDAMVVNIATHAAQEIPPNFDQAKLINPNIFFDIDVDKFIRKLLEEISKAKVVSVPPSTCASGSAIFEFHEAPNWYIDPTTGDYYRVELGKKVSYGLDQPVAIKMLNANNKCLSTGTKGNRADCRNYIINCLLSDNKDDFTSCMLDNPDFYKASVDEIKNMHPILARQTLRKFGFQPEWVYDSFAHTKIRKVQSLDSWINKVLPNYFKTDQIKQNIRENKNLLNYLSLLTQYINANPGILNKNYQGTTEEAKGLFIIPPYPKALNMKLRHDPNGIYTPAYDLSLLKKQMAFYRYLRPPFSMGAFGSNFTPGFGFAQVGGGPRCEILLNNFNQTGEYDVRGGKVLNGIFQELISKLESRGKKISPTDLGCIKDHINKLSQLETELIRSLCYIEEYGRLIEALGDRSSETVTQRNLREFVDRHYKIMDKTHSEENMLLLILQNLQKLETEESYEAI